MDLPTAFTMFIVLFFIEWLYTMTQCKNEALSSATNQTYFNYFDQCITRYSSKGLPYVIEIGFLNLQRILAQIFAGIEWIFIQTFAGVEWSSIHTFAGFEWIFIHTFAGVGWIFTHVFAGIEWIFIQTFAGVEWSSIHTFAGFEWIFIHTFAGVGWIFIQTFAGVEWIFNHQSTVIIFIFIFIFSYGALNRQSDAFKTMLDVFHALREDLSSAMIEIWSSFKTGLISLYRVITVVKIIEIVVVGLFLSYVSDGFGLFLKTLAKLAEI